MTWRIRLNTAIIRQISWVYHRSYDIKSSILYESRQIKYFLQQITDINIKTVYLIKSYLLRSQVGSRIKLRYDDIVVGGRHCYSKNEVMTKFNGYKVIEYHPPVKNSRRVVLLWCYIYNHAADKIWMVIGHYMGIDFTNMKWRKLHIY